MNLGRSFGRTLVLLATLSAETALATELVDEGLFFGFGIAGGTAATATVLAEKEARRTAPAFSAGIAEVELGHRWASGFGLALSGQSLDFRGLSRGGSQARDWTGSALGVTASWQYRRLTLWSGALAGSLSDRGHDEPGPSHQHGVIAGKAGMGLTLFRGDWMDVRLVGALEPLLVDGAITPEESLGRRLYVQQIGLAMSFYPRPSSSGSTDTSGSFMLNCYACGDLFFHGGRALLQVGSAVGRATAEGLFRVLVRR